MAPSVLLYYEVQPLCHLSPTDHTASAHTATGRMQMCVYSAYTMALTPVTQVVTLRVFQEIRLSTERDLDAPPRRYLIYVLERSPSQFWIRKQFVLTVTTPVVTVAMAAPIHEASPVHQICLPSVLSTSSDLLLISVYWAGLLGGH